MHQIFISVMMMINWNFLKHYHNRCTTENIIHHVVMLKNIDIVS